MSFQTPLTGSQLPVEIAPGGYTLEAPDLAGSVTTMSAGESATRSGGGRYEDRLLEAMSYVEVQSQNVFEVEVVSDLAQPAGPNRGGLAASTREGEPAIRLRVPALGNRVDQAVLYTDEAGVSSWIFPQQASGPTITARGGAGEIVFHLPRKSAPIPPETDERASRGQISKLGRRLVRVLAWATDDIVGQGALAVATRWETSNRPYAFRGIPLTDPKTVVDWNVMTQGRALFLIHGTFSSAGSAFGELSQATIERLSQIYGGRVFAFDHPSLYPSPEENAQKFLDMLPQDVELDLDIITHSRGGLVGREFTERLADLHTAGRQIRIRKAILVAAPNLGTILTDGDHGIDMLDRYTNLLTSLPDNAYTLTMEGVLTVVKLVLHGALHSLPGLRCMYPKGDYLKRLNASQPTQTEYYVIASDFTPTSEALLTGLFKRAANKLVDGIFGEENDGIVPTRGSYESEQSTPGFPVHDTHRVVFGKDDQVHHCNYFGQERTSRQILEWVAG